MNEVQQEKPVRRRSWKASFRSPSGLGDKEATVKWGGWRVGAWLVRVENLSARDYPGVVARFCLKATYRTREDGIKAAREVMKPKGAAGRIRVLRK